MGGVAHKIAIDSLTTNPAAGIPQDLNLKIRVLDAAGYEIVGHYVGPEGRPANFLLSAENFMAAGNPLHFHVNGRDADRFGKSSDVVSLTYDGSPFVFGIVKFADGELAQAAINAAAQYPALPNAPVLEAGSCLANTTGKTMDGIRLWYTESSKGKIAGIDPAGGIHEFGVPNQHRPVCLGAAGRTLYFKTAQNTAVAFNASSGTFREYAPPDPQAKINGVAAGGGYLYFSESTGKIAVVSPAGVLSEVSLGPGTLPGLIASDLNGNVYVDDLNTHKIGYLQAGSTTIGWYAITSISHPSVMTFNDAQGLLWIGDSKSRWFNFGLPNVPNSGLQRLAAEGIITSLTAAGQFEIATEGAGQLQILSRSARSNAYVPPSGAGPASSIAYQDPKNIYYVCAACSAGIHKFLW